MKVLKGLAIWGWVSIATIGVIGVTGQEPAKKAAPRGRLPAYYKDLVSPDQREEIYAIQGKYSAEIAELEAKIAKLKKDRDAEVERVLTPAQQARLKLLVGAKEKVAGATDKPSDNPGDDATPADAAKAGKKEVFPK